MATLRITLFGKFNATRVGTPLVGLEARKTQELLCYLLLYRHRLHAREVLAGQFWGDYPTAQAKKYLRQALWHLQSAFDAAEPEQCSVLAVEPEWVQIRADADLWVDVGEFEAAFTLAQTHDSASLDAATLSRLQQAAELYQDDLLVGWYQDWCLYERERLQNMFLTLLDVLINHCEQGREFALGLKYGERLLHVDHAHERTHRRMMRMLYLLGDRTAALRQYERCVKALKQELDVEPTERTQELYKEVAADHVIQVPAPTRNLPDHRAPQFFLPSVLERLKQLQLHLSGIQIQVQRDIEAVEKALGRES